MENNNGNYQQGEQDRRIENLEKQMGQVQDHIATTNSELGSVKSNVEWLVWAVRWLIVGIGGTIFVTIINIVLNYFKR